MMPYLDSFLEMMISERGLSINSILAYKNDLMVYADYLKTKNVADASQDTIATPDIIRNFITYLRSNNIQPRSIARKLSTLKNYYNFLIEEGVIYENPILQVETPKYHIDLPSIMTIAEIEQLLKHAMQDNSKHGIRIFAMIHLLYSTGLRVSELINIKIDQILSSNKDSSIRPHFIINGKGNKERIVINNNLTVSALERYLYYRPHFLYNDKGKAHLFPSRSATGHMTRQNFAVALKKTALASGLNPEKISPHILRHTFASHLLAMGAEIRIIQEFLGHADISSTQIYTRVQTAHLTKVITSCHPLSILPTRSDSQE